MGRITIFTGDDILSHQVKVKLDRRSLPYTEIALCVYPSKHKDVQSLSFSMSVPQVFFNTRLVGGAEQTSKELERWDKKCNNRNEFIKNYIREIGNQSLSDKRFDAPEVLPVCSVDQLASLAVHAEMEVELPDGTTSTVHDIFEKFKCLPKEEIKLKGTVYLNCFTGKSAVRAFEESFDLSEDEAINFSQYLLDSSILYSIRSSKNFVCSSSELYRLQCHNTPDVLNSYCVWKTTVMPSCSTVLEQLDLLLKRIEFDSLDKEGLLDHQLAHRHRLYPAFEETACMLQKVNLRGLSHCEQLAFGLNVYHLMMRYAFLKVGVPTCENSRMQVLKTVKFNIGGHIYSFQDWVGGILCGNKKKLGKKIPIKTDDPRCQFALCKPDSRIHYAINVGAWLGSRMSLPFARFTAENIDQELDIAARVFFEDGRNFRFDGKEGRIYVSKPLMQYHSEVMKKDEDMLSVIEAYLMGTKLYEFKQFRRNCNDAIKVSFLDLDCTVNASNFIEFNVKTLNAKAKGVAGRFLRFQPPKMHVRELARMFTLESLGILDTPPEERLDRVTREVQATFSVPIVLVSLIDQDRQWFKSSQWNCPVPEVSETGRDISFCGHAINGSKDSVFLIEDATKDDRFVDNPLVTGDLGLRFYAGCNLSIPDVNDNDETVNIGTLCLIDQKPRHLSRNEIMKLQNFAHQVRDEIQNRGHLAKKRIFGRSKK